MIKTKKATQDLAKSVYYFLASLACNKRTPSFLYISFFNVILLFTTKGACTVVKSRTSKLSNQITPYLIRDKSTRISAVFSYRAHGLACYAKGLDSRARFIGFSYSLDLIDFNEDDIVIDCGANVGDLSLYLSRLPVCVRYIGFEPSQEDYDGLCINLKDRLKEQKTYNIALGNHSGEIKFFSNPDLGDSSVINMSPNSQALTVPVEKLDKILVNIVQSNEIIKLLKLEAEGFEPEIIYGAEQILPRIEYIAADLGYERGFDCSSTLPEVSNFLLARGFSIVNIRTGSLRVLFKNLAIVAASA